MCQLRSAHRSHGRGRAIVVSGIASGSLFRTLLVSACTATRLWSEPHSGLGVIVPPKVNINPVCKENQSEV